MQATHVVGFSGILELGVPGICEGPQTQERNHPSGVSVPARSGDVGTSLDIGHLGGGLLVLHIHDRVERFVGPGGASHVFMGTR